MEEWKAIPGLENLYEASTEGRIRSLDRYVQVLNQIRFHSGRVLTPHITNKGYYMVSIYPETGVHKNCLVHRLVALTFIGAPAKHRKEINHKDHNKLNNKPENLEWVTRKQNVRWEMGLHPTTESKRANMRKGQQNHCKPIVGVNINTNETIFFNKIADVREYGFNPGLVCNCCKGRRESTRGYTFHYAEVTE